MARIRSDLRIRERRAVRHGLAQRLRNVRARIGDEDPSPAGLAAGDVPAALERLVGVDGAGPVELRVGPVAGAELHVQLGVDPRSELRDRGLLEVVEPGLAVIQRSQD